MWLVAVRRDRDPNAPAAMIDIPAFHPYSCGGPEIRWGTVGTCS